jgi:hypothetical protein
VGTLVRESSVLFAIRHSPFVIRHSPSLSPFAICSYCALRPFFMLDGRRRTLMTERDKSTILIGIRIADRRRRLNLSGERTFFFFQNSTPQSTGTDTFNVPKTGQSQPHSMCKSLCFFLVGLLIPTAPEMYKIIDISIHTAAREGHGRPERAKGKSMDGSVSVAGGSGVM